MASKYDKYKEDFIIKFLSGQVEGFNEYAKKKGWIKNNVGENGSMGKCSKQWTDEALAKLSKVSQRIEKKIEDEIEITAREALEIKRIVVEKVKIRLTEQVYKYDKNGKRTGKKGPRALTMHELKVAWEIVRTEADQPTSIIKSKIGEDKENPFTSIADVLNTIGPPCAASTIDESPPKGSG